ncbi:MAG: metallophosphoesterase [Chloroflexota bacterium]
MPIKNLPSDLVGKTLMQVSDVHIGRRVDSDYILDSFKQAQGLNPDFVVYTGDFVAFDDKSYGQLQTMMPQAPKGTLGTTAILGNHDYGHRWQEVDVADNITEILEDAGIRTLLNEVETFSGLKIGGMEDFWSPRFYPELVTDQIGSDDAAIILCHNPDAVDEEFGWGDYQGWILAGHTHGGQCKPPFLPPPVLPVRNYRYSAGQIDLEDGRMLYINRGLGHLLKLRFNVRPEITLFRLSQAT